ncbi:MAG: hypothetical protein CEE40_07965 [Chloroflexi bacterium B3_Chlor]|nr:MAG: hypothetical protein CEE40_07965 [Chloroflexi bacterium B3_Chlor]
MMLRDPVCGRRVNRHRAQVAIQYERVTYYLCCPLCQTKFERDPGKYAGPEWGETGKGKRRRKGAGRSAVRARNAPTMREGQL